MFKNRSIVGFMLEMTKKKQKTKKSRKKLRGQLKKERKKNGPTEPYIDQNSLMRTVYDKNRAHTIMEQMIVLLKCEYVI